MDFLSETLLVSNNLGVYEKALVTFIAFKFAKLTKDVHALRAMVEASQRADMIKETRLIKIEFFVEEFAKFKKTVEDFMKNKIQGG